MTSDKEPRKLSGVFDQLIESNYALNTTIKRYALVVLVAVLVMAGVSTFEVIHSYKTDKRLDRLEEKVFQK